MDEADRPSSQNRFSIPSGLPALTVTVFLCALLVPWIIMVGPMRLSVYRIVLIAALLPCLATWLSGEAGRIRLSDVAILGYSVWCLVAIIAVHGVAFAVQPSGILFVETVGSYLLARCYIRGPDDFYRMVRLLFWLVMLLIPPAFVEAVTGNNYAQDAFLSLGSITNTIAVLEPRWGLVRARTVFEHPILYGVTSGSILALTHLVLGFRQPFWKRWFRTMLVAAAAFLSLSSGPITALAAQFSLMGWDRCLSGVRYRWKILLGIVAAAYLTVAVLSNQSVPEFYVYYFAFSEETGWDRILIWQYGWASVGSHPLFGIGFNDWQRPEWMGPSMDMFWLVNFTQFGIPAGALMLLAFFGTVIPVMRKTSADERVASYKLGFLIAMGSFFITGWAVHYWNAVYVLFIFLVGSGSWILEPIRAEPIAGQAAAWTTQPRRRIQNDPGSFASPPEGQPSSRRSTRKPYRYGRRLFQR